MQEAAEAAAARPCRGPNLLDVALRRYLRCLSAIRNDSTSAGSAPADGLLPEAAKYAQAAGVFEIL